MTKGLYRVAVFFCLSYILAVVPAYGGGPQGVALLYPQDKSLVEAKLISVVVYLGDSDADMVIIARNGREIENVPVPKGQKYICKVITIDVGHNEIGVRVVKGGSTVESKQVSVFFRSDLSKKFAIKPSDYNKKPFHNEDGEKACASCHRMELTEKDSKPDKPEDSLCYQCHKRITSYPFIHGPVVKWACLTCHNKDSRPFKYMTPKPDKDLCFSCHKEKKAEWVTKKYIHGPTARGTCTLCHNPHASEHPYWLKKATWNLCVTCHEEMGKGKHMLKPFAIPNKTHPTRGIPDPSRPGKMISCASCHNPHASNAKFLFAYEVPTIYDLCKKCHKF